uniref:Uncharacterized protein n=1 Tax=Dulem virus 62 TaxID=3145773 RepID=A0AAU8B3S3_9VIRU
MPQYTKSEIESLGYQNGWSFGKYTMQVQIDDDLLSVLDNCHEAFVTYFSSYKTGVVAGMSETVRSTQFFEYCAESEDEEDF